MSGYGFYEEEEGQGIITGAGARAKRKYIAEMAVSARTGKRYPRRLGYTLEYAAKKYNKQLAERNPWLKYVSQDEEIKELRKQIGERMKQIAAEYRKTLSPEQRELAEQRAKQRAASEARKKEMIDSIIANFKLKYPTVREGFNYIINNKTMPNKTAARIFLRVVYGISKDEAEKLLPTGKRVRSRRYRTAIEREFLGPGTTITVSTAPEEKKKEETLIESKPTEQQTTTKKKKKQQQEEE
jgi:hypothetical protein